MGASAAGATIAPLQDTLIAQGQKRRPVERAVTDAVAGHGDRALYGVTPALCLGVVANMLCRAPDTPLLLAPCSR